MGKTIEQQAMERLRGAQGVAQQVLRIFELGAPSVSELAYAVKSRVKDDFKIVDKIKRKEAEGRSYNVKDIRDVVGVRVVTLYRLDALSIIPILLDRVLENSGKDEASLFLDNPIEEIKIYSVNPVGDAQRLAKRIEAIFKDRGYGGRCEIVERPENYSSTHVVLWARGKWNGRYLDIPIEVQIRTALEDVWAEIDHKLKYKRQSNADMDSSMSAMVGNCLAHLNVMKTLNDGLAQYGDQVKIQMDELDDSVRRVSRSRLAEEPEVRLTPFPEYAGAIKDKMHLLLSQSREALQDSGMKAYSTTNNIGQIRTAARELEGAAEWIEGLSVEDTLKRELVYVCTMEGALLEFEVGRRLGKASGNANLLKARMAYDAVEGQYPDRGIIPYRLSRVLYALGEADSAKTKMRALVDNFDNYDLPENHWVRASANRILGFWHWAGVKTQSAGRKREWSSGDLQEILKAASYSLNASRIAVPEGPFPTDHPHESPRIMSLSNLLFFVVEFFEAGGSQQDLNSFGITADVIATSANEVRQFDENGDVDYHKLNTLRRFYICKSDNERAMHFSKLAIENLEKAGCVDRGGTSEEEHVLRECRATLERFSKN